ncbi:MAG: hypothetical protein BWK79_04740 [Beggiatoa sp. IS2]|nr:MAG: hypothetical protein BWK79_04740 [Beggiatoa sp. IS2]
MFSNSDKPHQIHEENSAYVLVSAATCAAVRWGLSKQIDKITESFANYRVPRAEVRTLVLNFTANAIHKTSRGRCQHFDEFTKAEWERLVDELSTMRSTVEAQLRERYAGKNS